MSNTYRIFSVASILFGLFLFTSQTQVVLAQLLPSPSPSPSLSPSPSPTDVASPQPLSSQGGGISLGWVLLVVGVLAGVGVPIGWYVIDSNPQLKAKAHVFFSRFSRRKM